ncbi:MAG: tetratricopeptide repeat protein [Saprospiraceae bacterium]|nr:tetratricopeptide repeat protein [Pyrinomonadaceae bacterium]
MELFYDGKRWWISAVSWDEERPGNPITKDFLPKKSLSILEIDIMFRNRSIFLSFFMISFTSVIAAQATSQDQRSPLDPTRWGVVYDVAATKNVSVKTDVPYSGTLGIDIYSPPGAKAGDKFPAVIFLNAIGDRPDSKVKSWAIYSSWPRLVAAHGMVGISMDADGSTIQDSLKSLFDFIGKDGAKYGIDAGRLGVYAASANVTQSSIYLMGEGAAKGIKAAVLYYGGAPQGNLRKDLPVLFVLAEGDLGGGFGQQAIPLWQRVTESRAPWTMVFASRQPHAFDAFEDTDESRRLVKQTIDFWKTHLEPTPKPPWETSEARAIVSAIYMNDPVRSSELLGKYTAANPKDAQGFIHYARMLSQQQKFTEAYAAFETAYKLEPSNPAAQAGMGQIRYSEKRYAEAETHISNAISRGFRNPMLYGQLAYSQLAANKNEDAIKSYEAAFQMGIPSGANTRGLAYFNMACAYARLKNTDKTFEMLGKAIDERYLNRESYEKDEDLNSVRTDERFQALLARLPKSAN